MTMKYYVKGRESQAAAANAIQEAYSMWQKIWQEQSPQSIAAEWIAGLNEAQNLIFHLQNAEKFSNEVVPAKINNIKKLQKTKENTRNRGAPQRCTGQKVLFHA